MRRVAVLVIEQGEEAALIRAALARSSLVRVIEASVVADALERLDQETAPVALAIAGGTALAGSCDEVVKRLGGRGIPVVGLVTDLAPDERQRALDAGICEIHDRPTEWRPYSELIDSLVARFTPAGLPPRQGRAG
jgi:CheY-like chemotaxis protein